MFGWFGSILGGIGETISNVVLEWQKRKTVKAQHKAKLEEILASTELKKAEFLLKMAEQGQQIEADWDLKSLEQMQFSWKDEYLLILLTLPIFGSFIPGIQDYICKGWDYVAKTPDWYKMSFLGIVASSFGLRWLVSPLLNIWRQKSRGADRTNRK